MRVAALSGKLWCVDKMLEEMTPEQMDELEAFDRLEYMGLGKLYRMLALGFATLVNATAGSEVCTMDYFLMNETTAAEEPVSPNQAAALFMQQQMGG